MQHNISDFLRLAALQGLQILDSDAEPGFDAITRLAADLFRVPVCAISLIDTERQWFKSRVGIDACETGLELSFCDHAIRQDDIMFVPDASKDPRFCDWPNVTCEDGLRFYAGAQVRFGDVTIGTLCIADSVVRDAFTAEDRKRLRDLADAVMSMLVMRKDGLVKKDTIRNLNETRTKLEMMETIAGVGYWHFDVATREVQWSKGIFAIHGLDPAGHAPRYGDGAKRYHPEDWPMAERALRDALEDGKPFSIQARIIRPDGEIRWVRAEGASDLGEDGRPTTMFGVFHDITEQRQVEDALKTARQSAETFAQAQADFLSNMSHEIRTPLTTIIGYSTLLNENPRLPDDAKTYVQRLLKSGRTLHTLVNDVLDYSKLEAGQVELSPQPTDFHALASDIIDQFSLPAGAKDVTLSLEGAVDVPQFIAIDDTRLTQVLTNLIGNASKFTERGRITLRIFRRGEDRLRFEVEDTGPGISAEAAARLFQRFAQADSSVHRRHGGSGLGLSICQEIIRLMGGEIGVNSTQGVGSTFWFEIPLTVAEEADGEMHGGLDGLEILVVDDSAATRQLVRAMLVPSGAMVTEAENGQVAVDLCGQQSFDAVVMDIQMPVMDGVAAARLIGNRAPVIAMTASGGHARLPDGLFVQHLAKPIVRTGLEKALYAALAGAPMTAQTRVAG